MIYHRFVLSISYLVANLRGLVTTPNDEARLFFVARFSTRQNELWWAASWVKT